MKRAYGKPRTPFFSKSRILSDALRMADLLWCKPGEKGKEGIP